MRALKNVHGAPAPQSEPIVGREAAMVRNASGGYVFPVTDWTRLERFLILGTEGGTYYTDARTLTLDNAAVVRRCLEADGPRTVRTIAEISVRGRAPSNDPALFALAMAASFGNPEVRRAAGEALPRVARIGTHLLHFVSFVNDMRGWGRSIKRAVGRWYTDQELDRLTRQVLKYRQRDGWSHRDVLRLTHPKNAPGARLNDLMKWITHPDTAPVDPDRLPMVDAFHRLLHAGTATKAARLLREHAWLSREMVPTRHLAHKAVWEALLPNLPMTALVRNLPALTRLDVLRPLADATRDVTARLTDRDALRAARVHPLALLVASRTYGRGRSERGSSEWSPAPEIAAALEQACVLAFDDLEPIAERVYLAVDVSGSMGWSHVAGLSNLTAREAAAAMAMVIARHAERHVIKGFSAAGGTDRSFGRWASRPAMQALPITGSSTLREAVEATSDLPFGGTDCALPMLDALEQGIEADAFVVLTDNETWAGRMHPSEALRLYRRKTGIPARLVVVGMTATECSIADPEDAGMLDVVGFDTAAPNVIGDFIGRAVGVAAGSPTAR